MMDDRRTAFGLVVLCLIAAAPCALSGQGRQASTGTLVVLNKSAATATFIDVGSGETVATLPTGQGPHELAMTGDGRWAVSTDYSGGNSLTVIDVREVRVVRTIDLSRYSRPIHDLITTELRPRWDSSWLWNLRRRIPKSGMRLWLHWLRLLHILTWLHRSWNRRRLCNHPPCAINVLTVHRYLNRYLSR